MGEEGHLPISAHDEVNHRRIRAWRATLQSFLHESRIILKRQGVTTREYQGMLEIWSAANPGPKVGDLAKSMRLRHSMVVDVVNRLCHKKLALRQRSENDRRSVNVQLTDQGRSVLASLVNAHLKEVEKVSSDLRKVLS